MLDCDRVSRIVKETRPIFTKFGGKVPDGTRKKLFDFGGSPDHVTFGLG